MTLWEESQTDGLVQGCSNSSVLALELLQSCAKPSKWPVDSHHKGPVVKKAFLYHDITIVFGFHWMCQLWKTRFWKVSSCLRDSLWDHPQQCGPSLNILVCQALNTLSHLAVPRLGLQWCNCKDCTPVCNKVPINSSKNMKSYEIHMNICIVLLEKLTGFFVCNFHHFTKTLYHCTMFESDANNMSCSSKHSTNFYVYHVLNIIFLWKYLSHCYCQLNDFTPSSPQSEILHW